MMADDLPRRFVRVICLGQRSEEMRAARRLQVPAAELGRAMRRRRRVA